MNMINPTTKKMALITRSEKSSITAMSHERNSTWRGQ